MEDLKKEIIEQDKRGTSFVIFVVVEDKKIYGIDSNYQDGRERKDIDSIDVDYDCCCSCKDTYKVDGELPEECDNYECDDSFVGYRLERDVPNLYAGFFFTAKACEEHIANNRHHYNDTVHSYGISAYHNEELKMVLEHIIGKENINLLK